ncbi:MAG: hypothetical protein U0572_16175 [Phycisphaerales bacterium]
MRRKRRRPVYYLATALNDGTVLAACPIRKPMQREMDRRGDRLDADGVAQESMRDGRELGNWDDPGRIRFLDIIANNLNTRRAIRALVVKPLKELAEEVARLRSEVAALERNLKAQRAD